MWGWNEYSIGPVLSKCSLPSYGGGGRYIRGGPKKYLLKTKPNFSSAAFPPSKNSLGGATREGGHGTPSAILELGIWFLIQVFSSVLNCWSPLWFCLGCKKTRLGAFLSFHLSFELYLGNIILDCYRANVCIYPFLTYDCNFFLPESSLLWIIVTFLCILLHFTHHCQDFALDSEKFVCLWKIANLGNCLRASSAACLERSFCVQSLVQHNTLSCFENNPLRAQIQWKLWIQWILLSPCVRFQKCEPSTYPPPQKNDPPLWIF